ncbi:MAG: DUF2189 domain-containing protein [Sulfuricella denitrificans]|nr:DUF2189 domain-containing protein [Sulfuricella denitrificans]
MSALTPNVVGILSLRRWLREGWQVFVQAKGLSAAYAGIFALLGFIQFFAVIVAGLTPLVVALAGGFMLLGPALLCGFFNVADHLERREHVSLGHFFAGFGLVPPALWVVALIEMFLFLIWLTDAGVVYGLYFGVTREMGLPEFLAGLAGEGDTWSYLFFSGLMGTLLAFIIYTTSAFAVPLLYYRRANLAGAVSASVRAIFSNFPAMLGWGVVLSVAMFTVILFLLPMFPVVFPVLAYASRQAYREIFPV